MSFAEKMRQGSTVCFLGDSITAAGEWESEIFSLFAEKFSQKKIKFYNCGIGGDSAEGALKRVYGDCLVFSPEYVVMMFGMNDVGRLYYENEEPENMRMRGVALEKYKKSMTELARIITASGAKLILCTPTRYDDFDKTSNEKIIPVNEGLGKCAEFVRELAKKYRCTLVDFHKEMLEFTNLGRSIIGPDRVHPNMYGHHLMAQVFLKTVGAVERIDFGEYTEKNQTNIIRRRIESTYVRIKFCELVMSWNNYDKNEHTVQQRKEWIKEFKKDGWEWFEDTKNEYLKTADFRDKYMAELVKFTNYMYEEQ